jgi:hypothetical protein
MSRYRRVEGVVARRIAGELVLVPISANPTTAGGGVGNFYVLNPTAELLWNMLDSPRTADELAQHLTEEYEVDLARARIDVRAFLDDLQESGAIADSGEQ